MPTNFWGITKQPEPGHLYWLTPYEGVCDNCGAAIEHPNLPVTIVGTYQDGRGLVYWRLDVLFWLFCQTCKAEIRSINLFPRLSAEQFPLFAKIKGAE